MPHVSGILQYLSPSDWLLLLTVMSSSSICSVACQNYLLFKAEQYFVVMYMPYLGILLSVSGHLGCFQLFAVSNNATVNINVHFSFWDFAITSLVYIPRSRLAESLGDVIVSLFGTLRTVVRVTALFYIPAACGFWFPHILVHMCLLPSLFPSLLFPLSFIVVS